MPFLAPKATLDMIAAGASYAIVGAKFPSICDAICQTCASTFVLPGSLTVIGAGAAGAGMIGPSAPLTGPEPVSMAASLKSQLASGGIVGINTLNMCLAIATGIIPNLATLVPMGISPGVGSGTGTAKVIGFNPTAFFTTLSPLMAKGGIAGVNSVAFSQAISKGICLYLNAVGVVPMISIVGPAGPAPATNVFPGQFI